MSNPTGTRGVIIIDDSFGPITYYMEALRLKGIVPRHIPTAKEAIEHIDGSEPSADLYLLDIMMPVTGSGLDERATECGLTTGLHLLKRIQAKRPTAPVILLTNISSADIIHQLAAFNDVTILSKPDTLPMELAAVVVNQLNLKS